IAALCALSAGGAAMSFFAGIDESAEYVFKETHFDKMTGLLTRQAIVGKVAAAAAETLETGEPVYLIDIDIDRFKQINDAIGYSHGDELIRAFTKRLKESMPEDVVIGRLGAGEFAVLLPDREIRGYLERFLETFINRMLEPYQLQTHLQSVSMSVGIVAMPKDGVDPVLILRRSNLALQNARAGGIGNWSVFHAD
ncbi:GGDEF domain-containing protein, partial [Mesorhizobium sp. M1A.F.Ca.IN.020.06.1.1]|uniref:GGDEF domain-containing protein n=1 Tax=Mesorhizobium sp. M1A.F.Ca.IN.020.06.1.1 TaxID=2496765 RepID=UPI000FD36685